MTFYEKTVTVNEGESVKVKIGGMNIKGSPPMVIIDWN
jgi:hypothetical protein